MKLLRCIDDPFHGDSRMFAIRHYAQEEASSSRYKRRWTYFRRRYLTAKDFSISLREAFAVAKDQVPSITIRPGLVGGNPCVTGTRIPVYMILDAIEYYGTLKRVLKSYPQLTSEQVKDAVRFAKIALECCVEH